MSRPGGQLAVRLHRERMEREYPNLTRPATVLVLERREVLAAIDKLTPIIAQIPMSPTANALAYSLAHAEAIGWPVIRGVMLEIQGRR